MKVLTIILGALAIIGGIICLFTPGLNFLSVGWLVGLILLLVGIEAIIAFFMMKKKGGSGVAELILGIVAAIFGVILLINQNLQFMTDIAFIYIFGIWLIIGGIMRIISSFSLRKTFWKKGSTWIWVLIVGILEAILGIYALFHPMFSALTIGWLIALFIIMMGIDLVMVGSTMRKNK